MATRNGMEEEAVAAALGRLGVGTGGSRGEQGEEDLRRLRARLEARQRHLRARIAACDAITAEMAALRAALAAPDPAPAPRRPPPPGL